MHWAEDERRDRRGRAGLAMAVGFTACLLLGLLVQTQFEFVPLHDSTRDRSERIQDTYGRTILGCEVEAMLTDTAVDCPLVVEP